MERYNTYKNYLINKYKDKTYKLPIQIPVTCPNRDGKLGKKGCHFCSEQGTGFEAMANMTPILTQLEESKAKVVKRYKAKNFIGYFQNYTNTYLPLDQLMTYLEEAAKANLVGIDIATRPDSLPKEYLDAILDYSNRHKLDITFEIGLQIANDDLLNDINRGHSVDDYKRSVTLIKSYGFSVCTHLILNLPNSTMDDVVNTVALMNELEVDIIKIHSLYIAKDSVFGDMYEKGEIEICSMHEYVRRVVTFIGYLNPNAVVSRIVSRIPEVDGLFSNWGHSWWKVYNEIGLQLEAQNITQGVLNESE